MARKGRQGGTPATVALDRAGVAYTLHPYDHDPRAVSYGLEAAEALGVDPARVFKTLLATLDGELVVGIVPVSGQLDLKALARALGGSRAVMADVAAAERATGYVAGGISPIGQKRPHRTVLDASALDHADDPGVGGPPRARPRDRPGRPGRDHRGDHGPGLETRASEPLGRNVQELDPSVVRRQPEHGVGRVVVAPAAEPEALRAARGCRQSPGRPAARLVSQSPASKLTNRIALASPDSRTTFW